MNLAFADLPLVAYAAVFAASMLQAITGIGFGVLAGPVLLVVLASTSAIQVSIVLSFLIALVLAPKTLPRVDRRLLLHLTAGVCVGTPVGAMAATAMSLETLKLVAAAVVGAMTVVAAGACARLSLFERDTRFRRGLTGAASGALNAALAMPGPPVAAYATAIRIGKDSVRSTVLVTFLFAYPVALGAQAAATGLSPEIWTVAPPLALPTVLGTIAGAAVAGRVGETAFRWITIAFLLAGVSALAGL